MSGSSRVLVIEDDERIGASLERALRGTGYDTRWERSGEAGVRACAANAPDLVLLDLGLPGMDGLEVCRQIHAHHPAIDIVVLTARDEELDVVVGLDAGAVDYITKPFRLAELLARIRAQLRRHEGSPSAVTSSGDLRIEPDARRAWLGTLELELRAKEFDLLARLLADTGSVVTREALMSDVWDEHWFGSTKTLDFHIAALRRKIDHEGTPGRISTLRGVGYRLENP
ncbi:DNA-binding response regulator [Nocardioides psychrotolerans]|uniref:DNA-binding response regulator, OmpR family, contains REC and winged-helix (WHTH) domain n=1 Tax=Nocardioides psychrotolerans TaxID=1005945 RepID=A0A1I3PCJ7_9ACTN|nr:response regulator transcription factor [Nocardioides psychrotolerans]GEP39647.1 DNA-binding response regulator [Nocardioides psychrotolerans]SFJ19202.1 DNA-binding response regulator, OmpR family, contains REC and winged-helix (wHTH) domain [Nocardioides psychrotolerans]